MVGTAWWELATNTASSIAENLVQILSSQLKSTHECRLTCKYYTRLKGLPATNALAQSNMFVSNEVLLNVIL
jgi:hypothetical protein